MAAEGLDAAAVIAAWQEGLAAWLPDADQPLGSHTRALLALRVASFGSRLDALADCRGCGAALDVPLDLAALLKAPAPEDAPLRIAVDEIEALVRAPRATDLALAAATDDPARALFEACILRAERHGVAVPPAALPEAVREAAAAALAARDPLTEVTLALDCPECGATSEVGLDAEALLAEDVATTAPRLLAEVATLARAYGWSEAAILALPPARRRAYLALAG